MDSRQHDALLVLALALTLALASGACRPAEARSHAAALPAAPTAAPAPTSPVPPAALAERLSGTGLYVEGSTTQVRPELLSFAPQYPLWTDGAEKRRWIGLPTGTAIDASDPDAWRFPVGTRLWKEFSFGGRRAETRFMEALPDGTWRYATYLWLADGSDAVLAPARGVPEGVPVAGPVTRHVVPGKADCRACHEARTSPVLGFSALQLSSDRDPNALHAAAPGAGDVDLAALLGRGLVRGLPAAFRVRPPRIAARTPRERAALGYLHGNCGGCHNAEGPLAPIGLVLAQSVAHPASGAVLASTLGRASHFQPREPADATLRIAPGHAETSVLSLRMHARDPLNQMPPIGTLAVDEAAVALIDEWITEELRDAPTHEQGERP